MKNNDRLKTQAGFTLIELLVTTVVSLVVLFATLQLFENSQKSYVVQEEVAEMQQNVRIAKMFLERDIRMAGAGIANFSYGGNAVYPFKFENNIDGPDRLVVRYRNFGPAPCKPDPDGLIASCDDLPQLTLSNSMPDSATVAVVKEDLEDNGWDADCYCSGTTYPQPKPGMPFIVTAADGSQSAVLFHTSTSTTNPDKIGNSPNFEYEDVKYDNKLLNTFPADSTINFFPEDGLYKATYYIDNRDGIPCLVRDTGNGGQVIAEYIEDMQLSFDLYRDTDGDGTLEKTTVNGRDLTDIEKTQVRMVTINLVGRSAHEHRNFSGQRPAMEDHAAGAADGYRRRQIAVTVKVRNLGL